MNSLEKISLKIPYENSGLTPEKYNPVMETVTLKFSPEIGIRKRQLLLSVRAAVMNIFRTEKHCLLQ